MMKNWGLAPAVSIGTLGAPLATLGAGGDDAGGMDDTRSAYERAVMPSAHSISPRWNDVKISETDPPMHPPAKTDWQAGGQIDPHVQTTAPRSGHRQGPGRTLT